MSTNPNFIMAKRRAEHNAARFGHPHLDYPAIARKGKPLTEGIEAPPLPERDGPPVIPGWNWDTAVLAIFVAAMVTLLFVEV